MKYKTSKFFAHLILLTLFTGLAFHPLSNVNISNSESKCSLENMNKAEEIFISYVNAKNQNSPLLNIDSALRVAAARYIVESENCYDYLVNSFSTDKVTYIDEGGLWADGPSSEYVYGSTKWGSSTVGTPGGTVTYSFMTNGISLSGDSSDSSTAITSLPGYQSCFLTEIQNAFAAWQAVANIQFVQVADGGQAFGSAGATGDIRIGAHYFDGESGTLAHAYFPSSSSAGGDMHFDESESWSCTTNGGFDIGLVALHEIGHAIGLDHQPNNILAVMNPIYNSSLNGLQSDDISGAVYIYGSSSNPPPSGVPNDHFSSPNVIGSTYYSNTQTIDDATSHETDPVFACVSGQKYKTVWYRYTPSTNGTVLIDTVGSTYDTVLAVWTGSSGSLSNVACNDDAYGLQSKVQFNVSANTTYYIEVANFSDSAGTLVINVFNPANDDFDGYKSNSGSYYSDSINTATASIASDDPNVPACNLQAGSASVWYRYTPSTNGEITVNTFDSNYDTYIAVWTGSRGNLSLVSCQDDFNYPYDLTSKIILDLTANTHYYVEIAQWNGPISEIDKEPIVKLGGKNEVNSIGGGNLKLKIHPSYEGNTDFDGDFIADPAKFYSSTGVVWWLRSSDDTWGNFWLGSGAFNYVPDADFDGDRKTDPAKFVPSQGSVWYYKSSTTNWEGQFLGFDTYTYQAGNDFDGDNKADPTKLLPNGAIWYMRSASSNAWQGFWLGPEAFQIVNGSDFDGDGKTDPAKFIADPGVLWYWSSLSSTWVGIFLGSDTYTYISASDFDGDGKTDPAKYYSSTNTVWWLKSTTGTWDAAWMGPGTFTFIGGNDFDGDGKTDPAIYNASSGLLSWLRSSDSSWDNDNLGGDSYLVVN